jgi:glycosyltransferase involved in cell wall biosynthesis
MVVFAHYPGAETRVERQANALIKKGFEVDILCLRDFASKNEPSVEEINGAGVYRLSVSRSYGSVAYRKQLLEYLAFFVLAMLALIRLHPRRRYRVIQVHNLPDFLIFAAWFPKMWGARLILDLHDLMPEFFAARTGRRMDTWLIRLIILQERLSCHFANHVITVTEMWRKTLIARGLSPGKVSVVMNVADDRAFNRLSRPTLPHDEQSFHLLYHGQLVSRYGVDLIIQAVACLGNQIPGLRLTIHNKSVGPYAMSLVALAKQLGITDRVYFSRDLYPVGKLAELICTADAGLVPYRRDIFSDGILPTKLMEYTALGIPAIVARTPAIEAYFDETMVQFFTPGDVADLARSILSLYQDRERFNALAHNADRFNQRFNWTTVSADYIALVERISRR